MSDRLAVLTLAAWLLGAALLLGAVGSACWCPPLAGDLAIVSVICLGLGGFRPLGKLLAGGLGAWLPEQLPPETKP